MRFGAGLSSSLGSTAFEKKEEEETRVERNRKKEDVRCVHEHLDLGTAPALVHKPAQRSPRLFFPAALWVS